VNETAAIAQRFADGEIVLVGDDRDATVFVAAAADRVDRGGEPMRLVDARRDPELARLPVAPTAELVSAAMARDAAATAVRCRLPTRDGAFHAVGLGPADNDRATVALVHGDLASVPAPLVHVHIACLFGDAFGSLLCDCRARLQAATDAIIAAGAGMIVYAMPQGGSPTACARDEPFDAALAAGLLQASGVRVLRLAAGSPRVARELRRCGLQVADES
jgi:GTP cyclohydrolase II